MDEPQQGLLKTSLRFVKDALNQNTMLRISVLVTVLCITLACILLASLGLTFELEKGKPQAYSPRLFALLFLPAEFLIYDLILGNPKPRATLKDLYLDMRFLRLFWNGLKMVLALLIPYGAVVLLLVGAVVGFGKGGKVSSGAGIFLIIAFLGLFVSSFYYMFRFFYLSIIVARRDAQPLRTTFRASKGRLWKISCAIFLPYLAMLLATIPMELLGPMLERNLGFVGLAPWFLFDAGLTGFICCLSAAVLAFSYQRIVLSGADKPVANTAPAIDTQNHSGDEQTPA